MVSLSEPPVGMERMATRLRWRWRAAEQPEGEEKASGDSEDADYLTIVGSEKAQGVT